MRIYTRIFLFLFLVFYIPFSVYGADCSEASPGGNLRITSACGFEGTVNGVDSGTGTQNTANLAVDSGGTLTIFWGQSLGMGSLSMNGGTLVLINGGSISIGSPLWMMDADADGHPATTTQYVGTVPPVNARRRNVQTTVKIADSNDAEYCPDRYNPNKTCQYCVNGAVTDQNNGQDIFHQCQPYYQCNGSGACSLHATRVFISSSNSKGYLGGLSGGDSICQTLATTASLSGTWKAWLSDSTGSASGRLAHSNNPYILVDQTTKVADNWDSLVSSTLSASINKTENGTLLTVATDVWTNTKSDGSAASVIGTLTCSDWLTNAGSREGGFGVNTEYSSGAWTNSSIHKCNLSKNLYCFEQ